MAEASVPSPDWLRKRLQEADPDLLRAMVEAVVAALMSAEADARCGIAYGERQPERTNRRNGYREHGWIPASARSLLRQGSSFPDWLLEPRRRAERAIVQVVAEALAGQHEDWLIAPRYRAMAGRARALATLQESRSQFAA